MLAFNSCEKENGLINNDTESNNISVIDGILSFDSYSDYENAMETLLDFDNKQRDVWEKGLNFKSLRNVSTDGEPLKLVNEIGGEFATVLNPNCEIIIAGNYIQLDFENETAATHRIDVENCDLKMKDSSDQKVYSFYDDVDIFNDGVFLKAKNLNCDYYGRTWSERNTLTNGHYFWRLCYQSYWLKYQLLAEIYPEGYHGITVKIMANTNENSYARFGDNIECNNIGSINLSSNSRITRQIYSDTKRIYAYNMKVTFAANSNSSDYDDFEVTRSCGSFCN